MRLEVNTAVSKHNSESHGSLLARAPRRSKSGLSAWSRESRSGVRLSLSKGMSTKKKNDRALALTHLHREHGNRAAVHAFNRERDKLRWRKLPIAAVAW